MLTQMELLEKAEYLLDDDYADSDLAMLARSWHEERKEWLKEYKEFLEFNEDL